MRVEESFKVLIKKLTVFVVTNLFIYLGFMFVAGNGLAAVSIPFQVVDV